MQNRVAMPEVRAPQKPPEQPKKKTVSQEYEERLSDLSKKGLLCPNTACRSRKSSVLDTVQENNIIVRHRECAVCGTRFKTSESC